jgi:putative FmdB family regulatory protein
MPIYEYQCTLCSHQEDKLQKMNDPHLTQCPACHQASFVRLVSAAGFQLKGTGWYVTDFKDKPKDASAKPVAAPSTETVKETPSTTTTKAAAE